MKIKFKFFWLSLIILSLALFLPIDGNFTGQSFDKLVHLLLFAFLSMNACYYFLSDRRYLIWVSIFIFTLPLTSEYLQTFIKGRNYDVKDIVADVFGILVGIIIYFLFTKLIYKIYAAFGEKQQIK